jgi:hypothetical protein
MTRAVCATHCGVVLHAIQTYVDSRDRSNVSDEDERRLMSNHREREVAVESPLGWLHHER